MAIKETKEAATEAKKPRHRSPNYPTVGLREAVTRVRKLYEADGKAGAPAELAAVHIGFAKPHGQAMSVLAALKKFGLVSDVNGRWVPSQRAIEILNLPESDERRQRALRDAALSPEIYRQLVEAHKETGWPKSDVLESELVTYRNFNPNSVGDFVRDLKDSLEFAGLSDLGALELDGEREPEVIEAPELYPSKEKADKLMKPLAGRTPVGSEIPVAPDCVMGVNAMGHVTQGGIDKLIAYLQLIKGSFPTNGSQV
ncbi:MAG TPA: hypothetical protein VEV17_04825 [Bryobacteraceae bacterium]|nr:hypothetical protein [Bryobacteraceae bacterium]